MAAHGRADSRRLRPRLSWLVHSQMDDGVWLAPTETRYAPLDHPRERDKYIDIVVSRSLVCHTVEMGPTTWLGPVGLFPAAIKAL